MSDQPEAIITIVVPVFNRADIVNATLESIAAQTARPLKVVLVDNASTDGTREVLDRWSREVSAPDFEVTVLTETRPGAAAARNCGLRHVDTEWTMFFDSDDVMLPQHVDRALQAIRRHPDADIVGWDVEIHSPEGVRRIRPFEPKDALYHNLFHGTMGTQRYTARTDLFRSVGAWDEGVGLWDDIELGVRLLNVKPVIVKAKGAPTARMYERIESVTGLLSTSLQRMQPALERMMRTLPPTCKHWIGFKAVIQCALASKSAPGEAAEYLARILKGVSPAWRRRLYSFAYTYTRWGGRGVARILRPIM